MHDRVNRTKPKEGGDENISVIGGGKKLNKTRAEDLWLVADSRCKVSLSEERELKGRRPQVQLGRTDFRVMPETSQQNS